MKNNKTLVTKTLKSSTREEIRKEIVGWFLSEQAGKGTGKLTSRYRYIVETFNDYEILLDRPASFNRGIDFVIRIAKLRPDGRSIKMPKIRELIKLKYRKESQISNSAPSHNDIYVSLSDIKNRNVSEFKKIKNVVKQLFDNSCVDINELNNINEFFIDKDGTNHPYQVMLLALKWLFIEQDLTYWNWSGRQMLYNKLKEKSLV